MFTDINKGSRILGVFLNESNNTVHTKVKGNFITNSGEGVRQACLAGLGISNHSLWHVHPDLDSAKLVQVLAHLTVEPTAIYAVIPDKKFIPHKIRQLINFLEQDLTF